MGEGGANKGIAREGGAALVLVCAWAVFALSYFAYLAGAADGRVDIAYLFGMDVPVTWFWYETLLTGKYDFWQSHQGNSNYFADLAILSALYSAAGYVAGLYLWGFALAALSAAGWAVLCAKALGKNTNRAALVVLLHALPFLFMAWRGDDVFRTQILPIHHFVTWATMPWLLWLGARIVKNGCRKSALVFVLLLAFSVVSDPIVLPWFSAPFFAAVFLFFWRNRDGVRARGVPQKHRLLVASFAAGTVLGLAVSPTVPFASRVYEERVYSLPSFGHMIDTVFNLFHYAYLLAAGNPACALVWLVFAVVAARGFFAAFPKARHRGARFFCARRMLLLFVPLAMASTAAAVVATGLFPFLSEEVFAASGGAGGKRYVDFMPQDRALGGVARYLMPLLFFPLFAGWALYAPKLKLRAPFVGAAALLLAAVAAPRAVAVNWQRLDPYAHPFYECLHSAAKRLNAKKFVSAPLGAEIFAWPEWEWDAFFTVGAVRGRNGYVYSNGIYNAQMKPGPVDFVITNASGGKVSAMTPGREPYVCDYAEVEKCVGRFHFAIILDGRVVRSAFGEPSEVIECPGNAAIYHYDPPLDISNAAYGVQSPAPGSLGKTIPADF